MHIDVGLCLLMITRNFWLGRDSLCPSRTTTACQRHHRWQWKQYLPLPRNRVYVIIVEITLSGRTWCTIKVWGVLRPFCWSSHWMRLQELLGLHHFVQANAVEFEWADCKWYKKLRFKKPELFFLNNSILIEIDCVPKDITESELGSGEDEGVQLSDYGMGSKGVGSQSFRSNID